MTLDRLKRAFPQLACSALVAAFFATMLVSPIAGPLRLNKLGSWQHSTRSTLPQALKGQLSYFAAFSRPWWNIINVSALASRTAFVG
jgi:hypothetical protein